MVSELPVEKYFAACKTQDIESESSAESDVHQTIIGQERAVRALQFGLGIKEKGFNIYAAGLPGTGRTTAIENFLAETASKEPAPVDWCYVNDFNDNYHPNALRLPPGSAVQFRTDMESLIAAAVRDIKAALEGEIAISQRDRIVNDFQQQKQELLERVSEQARQQGFGIQATPVGLVVIPFVKGKPISEEDFLSLTPEQRDELSKAQQQLQTALDAAVRQAKAIDKTAQETLQESDRQVALYAIRDRFEEMKGKYSGIEEIPEHLDHVQSDILASLAEFKTQEDSQPAAGGLPMAPVRKFPGRKYAVNVLVDHSGSKGAPVVLERNPTYANLFGQIGRASCRERV